MSVWLLVLLLETGQLVPLAIFPPTSEGAESCRSAQAETLETMRQAHELKCLSYRLLVEADDAGRRE